LRLRGACSTVELMAHVYYFNKILPLTTNPADKRDKRNRRVDRLKS